MEQTLRQRNRSLDVLRGLACLCIILIHKPFPGSFASLTIPFTRGAVPFFFLVSGYFAYRETKEEGVRMAKRRVRHMAFLCLAVTALYLLYFFWLFDFQIGEALNSMQLDSAEVWLRFLCLNDLSGFFSIIGPFWFLYALLYVYLLVWGAEKLGILKKMQFLWPILLCMVFFCAEIYPLVWGKEIKNYYYRNFLIEGMGFFLLGHWFRRREDLLARCKDAWLILIACVGLIASTAFQFLYFENPSVQSFEWYFGSCAAWVAMSMLAMRHPACPERLLSYIGEHYSLTVYAIHMLVISLTNRIAIDSYRFSLFRPILVMICCIAFAAVWSLCLTAYKRLSAKKKKAG